MPFQPGQSGNPGGKRQLTPEQLEAQRMFRGPLTRKAVQALERAIDEGGSDGLKAAITVIERSMGKPAAAPEDREAMTELRDAVAGMSLADAIAIAKAKLVK